MAAALKRIVLRIISGMSERILTAVDLDGLSYTGFKVYENQCRRAADRQGFQLVKSRSRDPRALDYGRYMLVDVASGVAEAGELGSSAALTLTEVAEFLWG
jgi:hypothetical protein